MQFSSSMLLCRTLLLLLALLGCTEVNGSDAGCDCGVQRVLTLEVDSQLVEITFDDCVDLHERAAEFVAVYPTVRGGGCDAGDQACLVDSVTAVMSEMRDNYSPAAASASSPTTDQPSCAIVFNAGVLLKDSHGSSIDEFDDVYRFNMKPIEGYERHVGSRTTHQFVHFTFCPDIHDAPAIKFARLNDPSVQGVTFPWAAKEEDGYREWRPTTSAPWSQPPRSMLDQCEAEAGLPSGQWCSSGVLAVAWAKSHCREVAVFGAIHDPCYPYHYMDPIQRPCDPSRRIGGERKKHDFEKEHELLRLWHRNGEIRLIGYEP